MFFFLFRKNDRKNDRQDAMSSGVSAKTAQNIEDGKKEAKNWR
jgi:hypothetical protein